MSTSVFFLLLLVLVPVFIAAAIRHQKQVSNCWTEAARMLGGRLEGGSLFAQRRIVGTCDDCRVTVDSWSTGGKNSQTYTRYRAAYPTPLGLGLRLTKQNFLSGIAQFFGRQDLENGDRSFDASVVVQGTHACRFADAITLS